MAHEFNGKYDGKNLDYIAFPIGGLGAGMFCLEGTGSLASFSFENKPDIHNCPTIFAAVHMGGKIRVLEGPVPGNKIFTAPSAAPDGATGGNPLAGHGNGLTGKNYGLPRFDKCDFTGRFPFAEINLADEEMPMEAKLVGWSPFLPGNSDMSSLPFGVLDYKLTNKSDTAQETVFYFQCTKWMGQDAEVQPLPNGFLVRRSKSDTVNELAFSVFTDTDANIDTAWFRGGWWDSFTMMVNNMEKGGSETKVLDDPSTAKGATLSIPFTLSPGESRDIRLFLSWYTPESRVRSGLGEVANCGCDCDCASESEYYQPWYSAQFKDIYKLNTYIKSNIAEMEAASRLFTETFFASQIPPVIMEAVAANLSILKSPTLLRTPDGSLWGWEGCHDGSGCCHGSCTHVFNYAQAICHLFPDLERSLRKTEFFVSQDDRGHQNFRSALPISPTNHDYHAASDGQLGGVVKVYREWKISGDINWLKEFYPAVKESLNYCINIWDPKGQGVLTECHHNTYDIEFYGADIMCTSFYLAALKAASEMAIALSDQEAAYYEDLYQKGRVYCEEKLFNGEWFIQETDLSDLINQPQPSGTPEEIELFKKEGPKYQYGTGVIADGLIGIWLGKLVGLGDLLDSEKVKSHLLSLYKHNFKTDLSRHINPQRPGYALGKEGGLLLCSWPNGGKPSIPFVYSDEVWTGIEYEVASYLIMEGYVKEGIDIVEALRKRYDGTVRNPFNEYECGHWYARAMASYALLQAFTGARYDKTTKTMVLCSPFTNGGDFQCFFAADGGYGLVGIKDCKVLYEGHTVDLVGGKPYYKDVYGKLEIDKWTE